MSPDESLRSLSLDYLNLLINGQAFSDVTFSVEGRLVHAHRCILAARSLFFRKFFWGGGAAPGDPHKDASSAAASSPRHAGAPGAVIPVSSVGYEVFLLMLQFLYSGQVSIVPQKHEPRPNCPDRTCWHTHCSSAVDLALETLAAARSFGVEQLALLTQKQLTSMVEKASIDDVMKVLIASRKQEMQPLWATCSHLVAKSGLPPEVLAKHLPIDVVARIEELRLKSSLVSRRHHHDHHFPAAAADELEDQKIRRMRRALDSSDVELVKLMVMGEGLNLDESLALHYAVANCSREVVKALLELGAVPGLGHVEPNKLRLCLELVQSAAMVISREEGSSGGGVGGGERPPTAAAAGGGGGVYPTELDSRMVYLNLGAQMGGKMGEGSSEEGGGVGGSMYHHHHHHHNQY
ncbi:Regulatory protein NPR5 [Striga hermonthica]|uniref:Regulatory protein NPR5 n=1 Tax=Striga hermonthica TaxID=68872 RepID=A0A9N7MS14_STRHE|nr:Regulatory protein NPR5 [Striga hermonthica]